jgi:hypothetical protein
MASFVNRFFGDLESQKVWLLKRLFAQSFFTGLASAFFFVAAYASMLSVVDIKDVPYAYLASGLGGVLLIKGFQRIQKDYGAAKAHFILTFLFSVWLIVLYLLNTYAQNESLKWGIGVLSFAFVIPFSAVFALNIATSCFQVLGVTQGKKWVAKLGIAETLAAMLAFISAPLWVDLLGSAPSLFFVGGIAILPLARLTVIGFIKIKGSQSTYSLQNKVELKTLWRSPFFKWVIIATSISVAMIYWVDYTYIISVRTIARLNNMSNSEVVSVFFAIVKVGELLGSLFSASIIRQLGTQKSLRVFAIVMLSVSLGIGLLHFAAHMPLASIIVFIISLKWFERVVRRTVEVPANRIMLQVAKPEEKLGLQTALEGIVGQIATIGAALLVLLISQNYPKVDSLDFLVLIVMLIAVVSVFWVSRVFVVSKLYTVRLSNYLKDIAIEQRSNDPIKQQEEAAHEATENAAVTIDANEAIRRLYHASFEKQLSAVRELPTEIAQISQIVEMTDAAPLLLKAEILKRFTGNMDASDMPAGMQTKFNVMLMNIGESLVWLDLSIADLRGETESEYYLYVSLQKSRDIFIKNLFTLLSWRYSAEEMRVIEGFMTGEASGADDAQFAMELLDTILPPLLKPYLLPVFESTGLETKLKRWRQYIPAYRYSNEERLRDIVMRDFSLLTLSSKFWALRVLSEMKNQKAFTDPFKTSSMNCLRVASEPKVSSFGSFLDFFEKSLDFRKSQDVFVKSELLCYWLNEQEGFSNPQRMRASFSDYQEKFYTSITGIIQS